MPYLNKPKLAPCTRCGRGRRDERENGLCSYCSPQSFSARYGKKGSSVGPARYVKSNQFMKEERVAQPICKRCTGLSHQVPKGTTCKCGRAHGEMPLSPQREVIGSSIGHCSEVKW